MRRRAFAFSFLAVSAACAWPAAVQAQHEPHPESRFTGVWEVTFGSHMGDMTWTMTLEREDDALVGTAESMVGAAVVEGSQDGDQVEFTVFIEQPDHQVELFFSGTVDGDEAYGNLDIMGDPFTWTAKRVEAR